MRENGERGMAVTEFALILPILLVIIFGIIEGSRVFSAWLEITNDAREGARYGVVRVGDPQSEPTLISDVKRLVTVRAAGVIDTDPRKFGVTATISGPPGASDVAFTVFVVYKMDIYMPLVQQLLPNPLTLTARSTMRAE